MARKKFQTLTEQMYYILLSLMKECCGVDIAQEVKEMTEGEVVIGPGTLYTLLGDFEKEGLIKATKQEGRKKSYLITEKGKEMLQAEYKRLRKQVDRGKTFLEEGRFI